MPFTIKFKEEVLVRSRRCCCVCHEFAGIFVNVHHIIPEAEGGNSDLENAIVLCLRCHGEVGHYNPKHPIGNKHSPNELRRHRDEWWAWCKNNPNRPLHKLPISVSPGSISLQGNNWRTVSNIKIQNRTKEIYYDIIVKIKIVNSDIDTKDITFEPVIPKKELPLKMEDITIYADVFRVDAIDESGNDAVFVYLKNIDPGEIRTFLLGNVSQINLPDSIKPKAILEICAFAETPAPTMIQNDRMAVGFTPPENIQLKRVKVFMKRDEK